MNCGTEVVFPPQTVGSCSAGPVSIIPHTYLQHARGVRLMLKHLVVHGTVFHRTMNLVDSRVVIHSSLDHLFFAFEFCLVGPPRRLCVCLDWVAEPLA